jgi:hypothetical protein
MAETSYTCRRTRRATLATWQLQAWLRPATWREWFEARLDMLHQAMPSHDQGRNRDRDHGLDF